MSCISAKRIIVAGLLTSVATMMLASNVSAQAATANATIMVSATVQSACVVSASPLAFGTYSGAAVQGSTTVAVTCTNSTTYNVGLDAGGGSGATVTTRLMQNGSATLQYSLYSNSGRTTVWGTTIGTNTVTGTGNGASQSITVYGLVPANQYPTPGNYTDTVNVTVTY